MKIGPLPLGVIAITATTLAGPGAARAELNICNDSDSRVAVAVGYKDGEEWVTEGWWNLQPKSCEPILPEPLGERFYYIYARDWDTGGDWGGSTPMCTQSKVFTIRGVEDCQAKGYDRSGFSEVDTGGAQSWTVRLSGDAAASN